MNEPVHFRGRGPAGIRGVSTVIRRLVILTTAFLACAFLSSAAFAQTASNTQAEYDNGIYVNPFWLLLRGMGVGYEHRLGERSSLMIGAVGIAPAFEVDGDKASVQALNVQAQPHYYFGKRGAMRGPYVAPFVGLGVARARVNDTTARGLSVSGGSTIGWSFMIGPANLKLGLGAMYSSSLGVGTDENGDAVTERTGGFGVAGDLKMGFQF